MFSPPNRYFSYNHQKQAGPEQVTVLPTFYHKPLISSILLRPLSSRNQGAEQKNGIAKTGYAVCCDNTALLGACPFGISSFSSGFLLLNLASVRFISFADQVNAVKTQGYC